MIPGLFAFRSIRFQGLSLLLVVAALNIGGRAQGGTAESCTLKKSPTFRGLRLGMPHKQFLTHFPGTNPINMWGREHLEAFPKFRGLEMIVFTAIDGDIDNLEVHFGPAAEAPGIEQLTRKASEELNVPYAWWKFGPKGAVINCPKFRIDAAANYIELTDLAGEKKWKAMWREAEERANRKQP